MKFLVVEQFDGPLGFLGGAHLQEGEAPGSAGELIDHDADGTDDARRGEMFAEIVIERLTGEIPDEET